MRRTRPDGVVSHGETSFPMTKPNPATKLRLRQGQSPRSAGAALATHIPRVTRGVGGSACPTGIHLTVI